MIRENINEIIKELMLKRKDAATEEEKAVINSELEVVKTIKNTFTKFDKEDNALKLETFGCTELNDAVEEQLLRELKKTYEKAIEAFKKANAQEFVTQNELELGFLIKYMPKQATEEEITAYAEEILSGMTNINMGSIKVVLAEVQKKYPDANGKLISQIVKTHC